MAPAAYAGMSYEINWNQVRAFTTGQWELIRTHARNAAEQALQERGESLEVSFKEADTIRINGVMSERGEPFVLHRQPPALKPGEMEGDNEMFACKTRQHPYGTVALSVLQFANGIAPETLSWGRSRTHEEEKQYEFDRALAEATAALIEAPDTPPDVLVARLMESVPCEGENALEATTIAVSEVVNARYAPHLFSRGPLQFRICKNLEYNGQRILDAATPQWDVEVPSVEEALEALKEYNRVQHDDDEQWPQIAVGDLLSPSGQVLAQLTSTQGVEVVDAGALAELRDQVNLRDPYKPLHVGMSIPAQAECNRRAKTLLMDLPLVDVNLAVSTLAHQVRVDDHVARRSVELVSRMDTSSLALIEDLERSKAVCGALLTGLRSNGNQNPPLGMNFHRFTEGCPEYHFCTLLARAAGEWEGAFTSATRTLGLGDDFLELAKLAAKSEQAGEDEQEFCQAAYRQEQNKRANVYNLLNSFTEWREVAAEYTAALSTKVSRELSRDSLAPLAAFMSRNGTGTAADHRSLSAIIEHLEEISSVVAYFKPGSHRERQRDYLNMLEVAENCGLESSQHTEVFQILQRGIRGIELNSEHEQAPAAERGEAHSAAGVTGSGSPAPVKQVGSPRR